MLFELVGIGQKMLFSESELLVYLAAVQVSSSRIGIIRVEDTREDRAKNPRALLDQSKPFIYFSFLSPFFALLLSATLISFLQ